MKKKLTLALCALLLALPGCGGNAESGETQKPKDTVKVSDAYLGLALYTGVTLDPVTDNTAVNRLVYEAVYEGLFEVSDTFTAVPMLCESYTGDGTTFTFTLRPDISFSDGSRVTAGDVADCLQRAKDTEASPFYRRMQQVESIEALGDSMLRVTLSSPNVGFPRLLDVPICRMAEDTGALLPLGTGPFCPTQEEGKWYLTANETWHDGYLGQIRRLTLVTMTQTDTVQSSFETGDVSVLREKRITSAPAVISGSIETAQTPSTVLHYIGVNRKNETLAKPAVRRALSAAIDREGLCATAMQTFGDPAVLPVNPQPDGVAIDSKANTEKSAAELQAAEITELPELTLLVNSENTFKATACEMLQSAWKAAGITVTIRSVDYNSYVAALQNGDFDLYYGETQLMPDFDVQPLLTGTLNYGGEVSEEMLTAVASARAGSDLTAYYNSFLENMPVIPLAFERQQIIVRKGLIQNFTPAPFSLFAGVENWESK